MAARRADSGTTDVRGAILESATELFKANGADGLSMRQIASSIGYSATTIYLHFADKDALMLAVCVSGFEEFGAAVEAAARSHANPVDGIRASGEAYTTFALDNPMLYDVMFIRPKAWAITAPGDPESFQGVVMLTQAAMDAGLLRTGDAREAGALMWSVLHGVVSLAFSFHDQITLFERAEVIARGNAAVDAVLVSLT